MSENKEDEEKAFQAALDAVSKRFEAKIPGFIEEVSNIRIDLESMVASDVAAGDEFIEKFEALLKRSHSLAGSAGQFGHPELTELARTVEEMCLSIMEAEFKNKDAFPLLFQFSKDLENYNF